jgi:hypothetical protein
LVTHKANKFNQTTTDKPKRKMEKSLLHITVLAVLAIAGFVGIFSEPQSAADTVQWLLTLVVSKGIGAGAIVVAWQLYKRWLPTDKVLQSFERSGARGLERDMDEL